MRALAALVLVSGCVIAVPPAAAPAPVSNAERLAESLVETVNALRADHGAAALSAHPALTAAAEDFAYELARRRLLTHTSQRASHETVLLRIEQAGGAMTRAGENLASLSVRTNMPGTVVQLWLNSAGHRRNLLDAGWTHTGAAAVRGSDNLWYFVQLYGIPMRRR